MHSTFCCALHVIQPIICELIKTCAPLIQKQNQVQTMLLVYTHPMALIGQMPIMLADSLANQIANYFGDLNWYKSSVTRIEPF